MGRIVAIAGGDLLSTRKLNLHTIQLSNKANPRVLFVGTASYDAEGYIEAITKEWTSLGCDVKSLSLTSKSYRDKEIDQLLSWADIIYVGGGDTISMMQTWKKYGVDEKLKQIYEKDSAVLTGISAGAICWFYCGHSDSEASHNEKNGKYCWATGMLDIFHMAYCPHYNEPGRNTFDQMMLEKNMPGLAMENNTAFVENNGDQYYIKSTPTVKAYVIQYINGLMEKQEVSKVREYKAR